jgi:cell division septation protein DedD
MKLINNLLIIIILAAFSVSAAQTQGTTLKELNDRVVTLYQQGQYSEATKAAEEALKVAEETLGSDHPQLAAFLNNLAILYQAQGKCSEALPLYEKTLAIAEKTLSRDDQRMVTISKNIDTCKKELERRGEIERLNGHEKETQTMNDEPLQPQTSLNVTFTVQAGAFRNLFYAKALQKRLSERGYDAYINLSESKNEKKQYKVYIGTFVEKKEAETLCKKIKNSEGLQTFVTTK